MSESQFTTPLGGRIVLSSHFHDDRSLQEDRSLYKFLWVYSGEVSLEVDHLPVSLHADQLIALTPLHHVEVRSVSGEYVTFAFNSNFYCIYGHDNEVSCGGLLFYGASEVTVLTLTPAMSSSLRQSVEAFAAEAAVADNLREEMLRVILKQFIITCTRIARSYYRIDADDEKSFDTVRKFHVLVDGHFREKKQVSDYADMLCRSPKTLTNLFAAYGLPSPLRIIHERVAAESKRLLLYTDKSAKEISLLLGFADPAAFSRFFKKQTGENISDYRKKEK